MLKRLPLIFIPLLAILLLTQAIPLFMASLNSLKVEIFLKDWQTQDQVPTTQAWDIAYQASENSRHWAPIQNGIHYSLLGELYLWKAYSITPENPESAWRSAIDAFATDHQLRPTWPYPLLELVTLKMRVQEVDAQFDQWVNTFIQTAQWEGQLLNEFVIEALYHWPQLNHHQRRIVLESSAQALSLDLRISRGLKTELENTQLLSLFCLYLSIQPADSSHVCPQ